MTREIEKTRLEFLRSILGDEEELIQPNLIGYIIEKSNIGKLKYNFFEELSKWALYTREELLCFCRKGKFEINAVYVIRFKSREQIEKEFIDGLKNICGKD